MRGSDNYTPRQISAIREAIRKGRQALMRNDEHPRIFASAFIRAGGLQLPGEVLESETRRRLEIHVMANINGRVSGSDETPRLRAAIRREVARILDEVERFRAMMQPHLKGFRLTLDGPVADRSACERFIRIDVFGLGPGVVPPHEIVVLPPCCDGIRWAPVYESAR